MKYNIKAKVISNAVKGGDRVGRDVKTAHYVLEYIC